MNAANGVRDVACLACRNAERVEKFVERQGGGFHHQYICKKGLHQPDSIAGVEDAEIVSRCPGGDPRLGFQIGGYYSHMWFETENDDPDGCLEWKICSNGEFPTDTPEISLHICGFEQIESFVAFWKKELERRRGAVVKGEQGGGLLG